MDGSIFEHLHNVDQEISQQRDILARLEAEARSISQSETWIEANHPPVDTWRIKDLEDRLSNLYEVIDQQDAYLSESSNQFGFQEFAITKPSVYRKYQELFTDNNKTEIWNDVENFKKSSSKATFDPSYTNLCRLKAARWRGVGEIVKTTRASISKLESDKRTVIAAQQDYASTLNSKQAAFIKETTAQQRSILASKLQELKAAIRSFNTNFIVYARNNFLKATKLIFPKLRNATLTKEQLIEAAIDRWFEDSFEFTLDQEQKTAVKAIKKNTLVVARAGSGKTSTLIARVRFLVECCSVPTESILLLAFNRKAAEEMSQRLLEHGYNIPNIMTFHALAHAIVQPKETLVYDDPDNNSLHQSRFLQRILEDFLQSPNLQSEIKELMLAYFRTDWELMNPADMGKSSSEKIEEVREIPLETFKGHYVKSHGEKAIANFLFEHDIEYFYESTTTWNGRAYRPDFQMKHNGRTIIIEYFGGVGRDEQYDQQIADKKAYWAKREGCYLIDLYPRDVADQTHFEQTMLTELRNLGFPCERLSDDEIWERVRSTAITGLAKLLKSFVTRCRTLMWSIKDAELALENHACTAPGELEFLKLGLNAYKQYLHQLQVTNSEDFNGLLQRAIQELRNGTTKFNRQGHQTDLSNIEYLMVDEFQDFTQMFHMLLEELRTKRDNVNLFCVGDDWQAINGFAGSDLNFFEQFEMYYGPAQRLHIRTNYRSTNEIVAVGNKLMDGRGKRATAHKNYRGDVYSINHTQFKPTAAEQAVNENGDLMILVRRLLKHSFQENRSVAILSRTKNLPGIKNKQKRAFNTNLDEIKSIMIDGIADEETANLNISTTHGYKGLEADDVIIIDGTYSKYPLIHAHLKYMAIFGDTLDSQIDDERRLFYVALTRAKRRCYIVHGGQEDISDFVVDIQNLSRELDVSQYPPCVVDNTRQSVVIEVGNLKEHERWATISIKESLKACHFNWNRIECCWNKLEHLPSKSTSSIIDALHEAQWVLNGNGLKVVIRDMNNQILHEGQVHHGTLTI